MSSKQTTVRLNKSTVELLAEHGKFGQSYDDIVRSLCVKSGKRDTSK